MSPTYLTLKDILLIHSFVIDETGGSHGIRDRHSISGTLELPKQTFGGNELYPSLFLKAAVYARNIIGSHPFIDGNKRTGMTAAFVFLENNGYNAKAKKGDIEKFAIDIVRKKHGLDKIAAWLERHSEKLRK